MKEEHCGITVLRWFGRVCFGFGIALLTVRFMELNAVPAWVDLILAGLITFGAWGFK